MEKPEKYKVVISSRAHQMIGEHIRFLAQVSPQAARTLKDKLLATIRSLECFPERYGFLADDYITPNKYHKCFVEKYYLIIYQVKNQVVYVDYILDCRQDYQWILQ